MRVHAFMVTGTYILAVRAAHICADISIRPGSGAHVTYARRDPRWEDYEYSYVVPGNRFAYFGNGQTAAEKDAERDMTPYLKLAEDNDLRDLHERWWDL